ncbi:MAG: hypothetical protein RI885_2644 [Actinomycetota bacterium]|jgi:uncharacterized protein YukE
MDATTAEPAADTTTSDVTATDTPAAPVAVAPIARTDFSTIDDSSILGYLHAGTPELLDQIADAWSGLGMTLGERGADLELEFRRLEPTWTGDSAELYAESVRSLIEATRVIGTMSTDLGEVVYSSASALAQVCAMYPAGSIDASVSIDGKAS